MCVCVCVCVYVCMCVGNGVVVSLSGLFSEIAKNQEKGPGLDGWQDRLLISKRAHIGIHLTYKHSLSLSLSHTLSLSVVFEFHKLIDEQLELERHQRLGTTKKGIGPTYAAKVCLPLSPLTLRSLN